MLETLLKQYTPLYETAKTELETQLRLEDEQLAILAKNKQKTERIEMIIGILFGCVIAGTILSALFLSLMGYDYIPEINKDEIMHLAMAIDLLLGVIVIIGITVIEDKATKFAKDEKKEVLKKEAFEDQITHLVSPANIVSNLKELTNKPMECFASVSIIPAHYYVEKTTYAGIEPVRIGGKTLKRYKGGIIELEGEDLPPVFLSIYGKNGPETQSDLIQKYIFWDGQELSGSTKDAEYPCISEAQFEEFPDEIHTNAVCVTLFPTIFGTEAWKFLIFNTDAVDEIKTAMETLCTSIVQSVAVSNCRAMLSEKIKDGSALYRQRDLVTKEDITACFNRKEKPGKSTDSLSKAFEKANTTLASIIAESSFAAGMPTLTPAVDTPALETVVEMPTHIK